MRKSLVFFCILIISAFETLATVHVVTNTNNSGAGSLRHAVSISSPGDTVKISHLLRSTSTATIALTSQIQIPHSLTIVGSYLSPTSNRVIISGQNSNRIFYSSIPDSVTSSITLDSLFLVDGKAYTGGGAAFFQGVDTIEFRNCEIRNSEAYSSSTTQIGGSGVYISSNALSTNFLHVLAFNTKFIGNECHTSSGALAITLEGDTNDTFNCDIQLSSCVFQNNSGFFGSHFTIQNDLNSSVYLNGSFNFLESDFILGQTDQTEKTFYGPNSSTTTFDYSKCTFTNNELEAIKIEGDQVNLKLDSCYFESNWGVLKMQSQKSETEISETVFFQNSFNTNPWTAPEVIDVTGSGPQSLMFSDSTIFLKNGTNPNSGTLVYVHSTSDTSRISLTHSRIDSNLAVSGFYADEIFVDSSLVKKNTIRLISSDHAEVKNSEFFDNKNSQFIQSDSVFVSHCEFINHIGGNFNTDYIDMRNTQVLSYAPNYSSSGIVINTQSGFIDSSLIHGQGGYGYAIKYNDSMVILNSSILKRISAAGAAIQASNTQTHRSYLYIDNSIIDSNEVSSYITGAAIYFESSVDTLELFIKNSSISHNILNTSSSQVNNTGKAFYGDFDSLYAEISNTNIVGNHRAGTLTSSAGVVNIDSCIISNNNEAGIELTYANLSHTVVDSNGSDGVVAEKLFVDSCKFRWNVTAIVSGGTFLNSDFEYNDFGLAHPYSNVYYPDIFGCKFIGNTISGLGGNQFGIISDCLIDSNGIGLGFGYCIVDSIRNCSITNNFTGGGLRISSGVLDNVFVDGNYSNTYGGGITMSTKNGKFAILNSTISNNSSLDDGGGIYARSIEGNQGADSTILRMSLDIINSTINNNTSVGKGGGISYETRFDGYQSQPNTLCYSKLKLVNSTISDNSASEGGGIYAKRTWISIPDTTIESYQILNSTIYSNSAAIKGGISMNVASNSYFPDGTEVQVGSSIIANNDGAQFQNQGSYGLTPVISNGYNIWSDNVLGADSTDQLLVDSAQLDLGPLQNNGGSASTRMPNAGSFAINNGNPIDTSDAQNGPTLYLRDVGAAESQECTQNTQYFAQNCDSLYWNQTGQWYYNSDTIVDVSNNPFGCQSTHKLILTVYSSSLVTDTVVACQSYTWSSNQESYEQSGNYLDSSLSIGGCDSVRQLFLTIHPKYYFYDSVIICANESYTWPRNNVVYSNPGNFSAFFQSSNGCDSVYSLHLSKTNINTSLTLLDSQLIYLSPFDSISWIRCDSNNFLIPGESNNVLVMQDSGDYAAIVQYLNCVDTTICVTYSQPSTVGIKPITSRNLFSIFPNPTSGIINIKSQTKEQADVIIRNMMGGIVFRQSIQTPGALDLSKLRNGMYMVEIRSEDFIEVHEFVKQ